MPSIPNLPELEEALSLAALVPASIPPHAEPDSRKVTLGDVASALGLAAPAKALSSSNVAALSGTTTIDGVSLLAGERVLLTAQTDAVENGLWAVQVGAWTRPADFAAGCDASGRVVSVTNGTGYADSLWLCTSNPGAAGVGADGLTWRSLHVARSAGPASYVTPLGAVVDLSAQIADSDSEAFAVVLPANKRCKITIQIDATGEDDTAYELAARIVAYTDGSAIPAYSTYLIDAAEDADVETDPTAAIDFTLSDDALTLTVAVANDSGQELTVHFVAQVEHRNHPVAPS